MHMHAYMEGRCRQCGWRVVVDREDYGHTRAGKWCGPVETDHPFEVPDEPHASCSPVCGRTLGSLSHLRHAHAIRASLR